jgi:murein DD-endopeptidase MepM/ murein hydrolase activator NlpD
MAMPQIKLAFVLATCILPHSHDFLRVQELPTPQPQEERGSVEVERYPIDGAELLLVRNTHGFEITVVAELEAATNARARWEGGDRGVVVAPQGCALLGRVAPLRPSAPWNYRWKEQWWCGSRDARPDEGVAYLSPLEFDAPLVQGFHGDETHRGVDSYAVDLGCAEGTPVHAARAGQIVDLEASFDQGGDDPALRDRANYVRVLHADGTLGFYAHLKQDGVVVALGQRVAAGALLGYTGRSGRMGEPHLHFAVAVVDPAVGWRSVPFRFLRSKIASAEPRQGERLPGQKTLRD